MISRPDWQRLVRAMVLPLLFLGCVTPHQLDSETVEFKTLLKQDDSIIRATILIVGVSPRSQYSFCNGTYFAPGLVLTAAHCLLEGFTIYAFVPISLRADGPFTHIKLKAIRAVATAGHKQFVQQLENGTVRNDIAVIKIVPTGTNLLQPVPLITAKQKIKLPKTIRWQSDTDSFFVGDVINQVEIVSYKSEKNQVLKGVFLTRDSTNVVGDIAPSNSMLIALNRGTDIHQGVSGSGIFYRDRDQYYLAGVASHLFPGLNLLSAVAVAKYSDWIKQNQL